MIARLLAGAAGLLFAAPTAAEEPWTLHDALGAPDALRISGSARILWPPLARLAQRLGPRPCRVLDVATGGGDILRWLWRNAQAV